MPGPKTPDPDSAKAAPARRRGPLDALLGGGIGKLLRGIGIGAGPRDSGAEGLVALADALLSRRGAASGPSLASAFFDLYEASDEASRHAFLAAVHERHRPDDAAIETAIAAWRAKGDEGAAQRLHAATQAPTQQLIRSLNLAPQGTRRLLAMREDLIAATAAAGRPAPEGLAALDRQFEAAFTTWFNAGFLELRRIGWDSPARLLERIIAYEAVHAIQGWEDLRRRVEPADRRCYGFFHPQMPEDPLIFVEVALTRELPGTIHAIIAEEREIVPPAKASCAIFYSISNCQQGLRGIPFGNFLIKRVVALLKDELDHLETFATLSPVPGFAKWLSRQPGAADKSETGALCHLAATYLVTAKGKDGAPLDPVARFHLGNGARLEAIHPDADLSANGQKQSHGVMVNYLYDLGHIEENHLKLTELGEVVASKKVRALLAPPEEAKGKGKVKKAGAKREVA